MTGCSESSGVILKCYECGNEFNSKDGTEIEVVIWKHLDLTGEYDVDICPDCDMWRTMSKWAKDHG